MTFERGRRRSSCRAVCYPKIRELSTVAWRRLHLPAQIRAGLEENKHETLKRTHERPPDWTYPGRYLTLSCLAAPRHLLLVCVHIRITAAASGLDFSPRRYRKKFFCNFFVVFHLRLFGSHPSNHMLIYERYKPRLGLHPSSSQAQCNIIIPAEPENRKSPINSSILCVCVCFFFVFGTRMIRLAFSEIHLWSQRD